MKRASDKDAAIRPVLLANLQQRSGPGTLIVEELGLCEGAVRIDVAAINGSIHGYEIKSDPVVNTVVPSSRSRRTSPR